MKTKLGARTLAMLGMMGMAACVGNIGDAGPSSGAGGGKTGSGSPGGAAGTSSGSTPQCAQGASLAPARLSLISDDQYRNIVHDVFGVTFPATTTITGSASKTGSFSYDETADLQATTIQKYQRAADVVASLVTWMGHCTMGPANAAYMTRK